MPTEITLVADSIDDAAEQTIHLLEGADNRRDVIYFHGWLGWGASAVLKAVVKKLRSSSGLADTGTARGLGKIIHVDCSQWQSKRALQKAIAEELVLPPQVMALFDQHDEEEDFDGVDQSARGVIPYVKAVILNELMACNFLVVLHNGSGSYIDLWEAGVPVMGQLSRRVLWTSRGRFWHHANDSHIHAFESVESAKLSDIAIFPLPSPLLVGDGDFAVGQVFRHVLYTEAEEVAMYTGVPEADLSPKVVIECVLYRALRDSNDHNINWESHASNYWVCDGIIQDGTDGGRSAWEISDALQRNMSLVFCSDCTEIIGQALSGERQRFINHWVSVTNQKNSTEVQLSSHATSLFWIGGGLEACMFEHSNKTSLRVIHLSHCAFSFSSPPFLSCRNLRFLLLDHCKDKDGGEENDSCHHHSHHSQVDNGGAWFRNLWVLEISYTDWYWLLSKNMLDLMVDLRELNVKGVGNQSISHLHHCSGIGSNSRKLLKVGVVAESYKEDDHDGARKEGDRIQQAVASFPDLSSWHMLKTIVLDGCGHLEIIDSDALPLSLELFSLTGNETTKIKRISFRGRTQLKDLLLRGLFDNLEELDMSGTAIKLLDLSATQAKGLKRLLLLGCEKLHAILWPQAEDNKDNKVQLEVLRIDTTTITHEEEGKSNKQQEATASYNASIEGSSLATMRGKDRTIINLDSYISIRDPRFFRSLMHLRHSKELQVEISSTGGHKGTTGRGIYSNNARGQQKPTTSTKLYYADDIILTAFSSSHSQADDGADRDLSEAEASTMKSMWLWHCPHIPMDSDWARCYISIQDETRMESLQGTSLPSFVHLNATTLHLHDSLLITCLPGGPAPAASDVVDLKWNSLCWCQLERCPNFDGVVFTTPPLRAREEDIFENLETFWASQLRKARYIWYWSQSGFRPGEGSFEDLVFLHLDYCPRLVHVLPLYTSNTNGCRSLETLEIVCCDDLREVFPIDYSESQEQEEEPREFPSLKRIHLYELPKLQHICGRRMIAPKLETMKIRGCWSLKRLPAVQYDRRSRWWHIRSSPPTVDCEKNWWEGLEWDGEAAGHHPSHYKLTHSAYWNKTQLRTSVLR